MTLFKRILAMQFAYRAWRDLNKTPAEIATKLELSASTVRRYINLVGNAVGGPTPASRRRDTQESLKVAG